MTDGNHTAFARPAMRDELGHQWKDDILSHDGDTGLTKREYFAGLAMQGLLASGVYKNFDDISDALGYADALIAALNEKTTAVGL